MKRENRVAKRVQSENGRQQYTFLLANRLMLKVYHYPLIKVSVLR
tara:strand:+ start:346 stop:480 length:135 start_codon:yes stop_codon:yes gene_type:complete